MRGWLNSFMIAMIAVTALSLTLSSFVAQAEPAEAPSVDWQKHWWLEKTARLLRGGDGLSSKDNVDSLMKMSEDDIIRKFMDDPRFGDAIFDFNTYFLGFKNADVVRHGTYVGISVEISNALLSAQEMLKGGDYFRLFDLMGPVFVSPLSPSRSGIPTPGMTAQQNRKNHIRELQKYLQAARKGKTSKEVCQKVGSVWEHYHTVLADGYPAKVLATGLVWNPDLGLKLQSMCSSDSKADLPELTVAIDHLIQSNELFFNEMAQFEVDSGYHVKDVRDFKAMDLKAAGLSERWFAFGFDQNTSVMNSSTNRSRKRAAYVLKHYFCDDLTPVGVDSPEVHTGGEHGTETSCYSCHFKLDPMAGFFRNYGILATDFSRANFIYFDDGAQMNRRTYEDGWKASAEAHREWNIGYIRSVSKETSNSYGENLEDLSKIIRAAPEAKACLVKRMFEYFVSDKQTVDAGYLQRLTDQLIKESKTNSSIAVKNTIQRILTSRAFHQRDLDSSQCYDQAAGESATTATPAAAAAEGNVPCRVAYLLEKNCVRCHTASLPRSNNGGLHLNVWTGGKEGLGNFEDSDRDGKSKTPQETFAHIIQRLSTNEPKQRMPYKKTMSDQDRQELFHWAQKTLSSLPKEAAQ